MQHIVQEVTQIQTYPRTGTRWISVQCCVGRNIFASQEKQQPKPCFCCLSSFSHFFRHCPESNKTSERIQQTFLWKGHTVFFLSRALPVSNPGMKQSLPNSLWCTPFHRGLHVADGSLFGEVSLALWPSDLLRKTFQAQVSAAENLWCHFTKSVFRTDTSRDFIDAVFSVKIPEWSDFVFRQVYICILFLPKLHFAFVPHSFRTYVSLSPLAGEDEA